MDPKDYSREFRDLLNGLRGKDRAKMIYAIAEAFMAEQHAEALFCDYVRTIVPDLKEIIKNRNSEIMAADDAMSNLVKSVKAEIAPLFGPYARICRSSGPSYYHHHQRADLFGAKEIVDQYAWQYVNTVRREMHTALLDFRKSLEPSAKPAKNNLTPEERKEIIENLHTVKALPASTTPNAAGEIEV